MGRPPDVLAGVRPTVEGAGHPGAEPLAGGARPPPVGCGALARPSHVVRRSDRLDEQRPRRLSSSAHATWDAGCRRADHRSVRGCGRLCGPAFALGPLGHGYDADARPRCPAPLRRFDFRARTPKAADRFHRRAPSNRSSFFFQWSPPVNPPSPFVATTRWQGITTAMGFFPSAWPTARCAFGWPIALATCP